PLFASDAEKIAESVALGQYRIDQSLLSQFIERSVNSVTGGCLVGGFAGEECLQRPDRACFVMPDQSTLLSSKAFDGWYAGFVRFGLTHLGMGRRDKAEGYSD